MTTHAPSRWCYQKGCNDPACKEANRRYKNSVQAGNKARTQAATETHRLNGGVGGIPSLEHGKENTYNHQGCRCQECKEANKTAQKKYRQQRTIRRLASLI